MRLYVICHNCHAKILISTIAYKRSDLPYTFVLQCSLCSRQATYYSYEVFAEAEPTRAAAGAIIGGILGAVFLGPIGALTGSIILGGAGASADNADREAVEGFNRS